MPTREDVDLARTAIDRGFLTIKESIRCLEIQRDHEKNGTIVPLERVFLEAQFLTPTQLATLKESLARTAALRKIGHYEILSKVGAGGMGTVYKAKDARADRIVALKVLSPGHASNKEYIERFLREAHASGHLSHPNIVQGYDAGEAGGQYYFAMEFVDGTTVGEMLKEGRAIPEQQALDIGIQVAKALEHAEEHHIVHRDVKPDNIMITKDGTAKLADLGLARLTTGSAAAQDKRTFGTPYYASPEQCEGTPELDSKSDMYSFGATLFHMLSGRVPFNGQSPEEIMTKHFQEKPPYLKDINVQLSHGVSKIVRKLMSKDKRERYAQMSEAVKDLTLVRMGRSPKLGEHSQYDSGEYRYRSSTGSWRTKQPDRRKRLLLAAACVGIALFVLLGGYVIYQIVGPRSAPAPPPVETATSRPVAQAPARPPDRAYLEDVLATEPNLAREEFLRRLRSVGEKYPGTESASKAAARAAAVLKEIEAEAEPLYIKCKADAAADADARRYQAAYSKVGQFPARYGVTRFAGELAELKKDVELRADADFRRIRDEAKKLADAKKFAEAIDAYRPVTETFGVPEMTREAAAAVRKFKEAKDAADKLAADEAQRREREAAAQKERDTFATAAKDLFLLVTQSKFGEAKQKIEAAVPALTEAEHKEPLVRAAADLAELQKCFDALKQASVDLKARDVTVVRKGGTELKGNVFRVSPEALALECDVRGIKAIRTVPWDDLSPGSIKALLELKGGGKLDAAERRALAAFFFFSGRTDDAKGELDALAADPQQKDAADARRKDYVTLAPDAK